MHQSVDVRERPAQFGLGSLLVAVTAASVLLGLLKAVGVFGALIAFLAAVLLTLVVYPRLRPHAIFEQEALFDFVWGIVMPLICLAVDPIVFKHGDINLPPRPDEPWALTDMFTQASFYPHSLAAYTLLGWQIALLAMALAAGCKSRSWAEFLAGSFHVGFAVAVFLGVLALLPSLLCLYVGIGLLGFTPLFTAFVLRRRIQWAEVIAATDGTDEWSGGWLLAGMATAVTLPLAMGGLGLVWMQLR